MNINELEKVLMDQIEKLNDDSIGEDAEQTRLIVDRSKAMSDLTNNIMAVNRFKLDVVKQLSESGTIPAYEKYLGIEDGQKSGKKSEKI